MDLNLTLNEQAVIKSIALNDYQNGDPSYRSAVWANCLDSSPVKIPSGRALSAIVASLSKKGIVGTADDGDDAIVWLTEMGAKLAYELIAQVES